MMVWLPAFAMLCGAALLLAVASEAACVWALSGVAAQTHRRWRHLILAAGLLLLVGMILGEGVALAWRVVAGVVGLAGVGTYFYGRVAFTGRGQLHLSAVKRPSVVRRVAWPLVAWVQLGGMMLVVPALWFPSVRPEFTMLALGLYSLLLAAGTALGLSLWPRSEIDVALVVLLMAAMVGAASSDRPDLTLPKVTSLLLGLGLYYALLQWQDEWAPCVTLMAMTALACLFVIVGLTNGLSPAKVPVMAGMPAYVPRFLAQLPEAEDGRANMNQLGGALLLVIPVLLALLVGRRNSVTGWLTGVAWILVLISCLLLSGALVITQSRGAWGGMIVGGVLVLALSRNWGKWVAGLGAVTLLLGWVLWGRQHLGADIIQILIAQKGLTTPVGKLYLAGRLQIWRTVLASVAGKPWSGCGWGTLRATSTPFPHAHNVLLQVTYDMGVPGLVAYLAMVVVAVRQCLATMCHSRGMRRSIAVGGLGALVAYHVYGMVDVVALGAKPGVLWWCLLALIVAAGRGTPILVVSKGTST